MMYILFYDISDDKLRNKISKLLISKGYERLQLSVFTGLENPVKDIQLWLTIQNLLKSEPNSKLYVLPVKKDYFCSMQGFGLQDLDLEYLAGLRSSLIF